jgi:hypothetical protein
MILREPLEGPLVYIIVYVEYLGFTVVKALLQYRVIPDPAVIPRL